MEWNRSDERDLPELCDHCGYALVDSTPLYDVVSDSSSSNVRDPELDGKRLVTACSQVHLSALQIAYRMRPFIPEELWADKIDHALSEYPQGLSRDRIAEETGLSYWQISRGINWHNEKLHSAREIL